MLVGEPVGDAFCDKLMEFAKFALSGMQSMCIAPSALLVADCAAAVRQSSC